MLVVSGVAVAAVLSALALGERAAGDAKREARVITSANTASPRRSTWAGLPSADAAAWLAATPASQQATAIDWALAFPHVRVAVGAGEDVARLGAAMRGCVTQAAADEAASGRAQTLGADIAAACAVLLGWVTPES
ncbi:MAG: hypothetical protein ABW321_24420 [Polyangiales bacterium]